MRRLQMLALAPILIIVLFIQACFGGGNFANQVRIILAASGPLIQSLPLSESVKNGLIVDFTDLASGAANLKVSLDACSDKPCKLNAVDTYARLFEAVGARGNFGSHDRLETVQRILQGIIASARIFYGAPALAGRAGMPPKSMDAQLKALKAAMTVE